MQKEISKITVFQKVLAWIELFMAFIFILLLCFVIYTVLTVSGWGATMIPYLLVIASITIVNIIFSFILFHNYLKGNNSLYTIFITFWKIWVLFLILYLSIG
jgi:hypothetical protein